MAEKISISIDEWVLQDIDKEMSRRQKTNKSEFVQELIIKGMQQVRRETASPVVEALTQ